MMEYDEKVKALQIRDLGETRVEVPILSESASEQQKEKARELAREAAIYAFSTKYDDTNSIIQKAIWEHLGQWGRPGHPEEILGVNELYNTAEFYANNWRNVDGTININVIAEDKKAQYAFDRIDGNKYQVGPFKIGCDATTVGKIEFSKIESYSITDQNGRPISGATLVNKRGSTLRQIPDGVEFYVKYPKENNSDVTEVNINAKIKYLSDLSGTRHDYKTISRQFYYDWEGIPESTESGFRHAGVCPSSGQFSNGIFECTWPTCQGSVEYRYNYEPRADLKIKPNSENENDFQDMRKVKGELYYDYMDVHVSAKRDAGNEMEIAGDVWEDIPQGKDSVINGWLDSKDKMLEGIEVRLYTEDGQLAKVGDGFTNPMLTDRNGHYSFKGLDVSKKYYVVFTYDGMFYTNTYGAGRPIYNTEPWNTSSKGSEVVGERNGLNEKFVTISSYPTSYKTTQIFSPDPGYCPDGYNTIFKGEIVDKYKKLIKERLKTYLASNKELKEDTMSYVGNIYLPIINSSSNKLEAKQVLQYIWDCRINSYAGYESEQDGTRLRTQNLYPYYDKFVLQDKNGKRLFSQMGEKFDSTGAGYIYNGQLHVNLGLITRPTTDLELTEDLYKAVVSINGQDETYNFGTFDKKGIKINKDINSQIEQKVSTNDYNYKSSSNLSELDKTALYPVDYAPMKMYVTYRINVQNKSSIPTALNEIVTYKDSNYYSYSDDYITRADHSITGIEAAFVTPISDTEVKETNLAEYDATSFGLKVNPHSKYGEASETGKEIGTDIYISFNDNQIILEQNEVVAIYITYKIGGNTRRTDEGCEKFNCTYGNQKHDGWGIGVYKILQDIFKDNKNHKEYIYTRAEINSYSTFFNKDKDVDKTRNKYNSYYKYASSLQRGKSYRAAGVIDALSTPGNLDINQIREYEENKKAKTEDDWDRASAFVLVDGGGRSIQGNVWETVANPANVWATNPDYPIYEPNFGAQDITVELIELKDGIEYIRAKTTTDFQGAYEFKDYIPGLYTIRFIYGDKAKYDTTQHSKYSTFTLNNKEYNCAYNGQFYQSAKANPYTNNKVYWYADNEGARYSDAYDEVTIRDVVNKTLQEYKYKDVVNMLKNPTDYMVYAYTSLLDLEVEKATEIADKTQQPGYTITNIDFGLTPRTESRLTIDKEVTHLKLIQQNGAVQFDADTKTIREQGVPAVVQARQGYDINISMSSELINGATLEITYTVTVKNESPEDSVTYYKDVEGNKIALGLYKEALEDIVYYEEGEIRTYDNRGKMYRNQDKTWSSRTPAGTTIMKQPNPYYTETINTTTRANMIADFVSNNLNFTKLSYAGATINQPWDLYTGTKTDFENTYYKQDNLYQELEPQQVPDMTEQAKEIYDSNTIVVANRNNRLINTDLASGQSVSENIVLTKIISVNDNSTDTRSYNNKVRILDMRNSVSKGQDMGGSRVVHKSENVIVSDPTGLSGIYQIIAIVLLVVAIIGIGIYLIRRYVIRRR